MKNFKKAIMYMTLGAVGAYLTIEMCSKKNCKCVDDLKQASECSFMEKLKNRFM